MRQVFKTEANPVDVTADLAELSKGYFLRFIVVEKAKQTSDSSVTFMAMDGNRYTTTDKDEFRDHFRTLRVSGTGSLLCCAQLMCDEETDRQVRHLASELRNSITPGQRIAFNAVMQFLTPSEKDYAIASRPRDPWGNDASNGMQALVA